jgi:hypothetical protein
MNQDPIATELPDLGTYSGRLFLHEPGWHVGLKVGSERTFCYMIAPGQDFYHRIFDGEIFLYRSDERICMACATRRGVITHEPKSLREPWVPLEFDTANIPIAFELNMVDETDRTA